MDWFTWSILLLLLGLVLIVAELFIPSGGILGSLAGAAILCGLVFGFFSGFRNGSILLGIVMVVLPALLVAAVRFWPETPLGKLILIPRPENEDDLLPEEEHPLNELVDQIGKTRTKMLPGGVVDINGHSYDATTEGEPLEPGQRVRVVRVSMHRLVVRAAADATDSAAEPLAADPADPLSQGLEAVGLDPNEDPLS